MYLVQLVFDGICNEGSMIIKRFTLNAVSSGLEVGCYRFALFALRFELGVYALRFL